MLTFQIEPVERCWNEVMLLAHQHWAGTKSYRRHEPFNPSFERYQLCNISGFFHVFTARDGDKLAGYFSIYRTQSMHSQLPMVVEDVFYLHPDYRGGRNALRFIKFVEAQCRAWGVHEILFSCEIDNETGIQRLLELLAYSPVIRQYSKTLPPPDSDTVHTHAESGSVHTAS